MTSLLLLLPTLLASLLAPAADDTLTAEGLLDKAARFQRGDEPREAPAGLHGLFWVHVYNHEDGSSADVNVERWYQRAPERMLTRTVVDSLAQGDMTTGFDGKRVWMQDHLDDDSVRVYNDDPEAFATDIELNAEQRRLTRLILDALLIDGLRPQLRDVQLVPLTAWVEDLDGFRHEVRLVKARIDDTLFGAAPVAPGTLPPDLDDAAPELQLHLSIDAETGALRRLVVETVKRSPSFFYELRFDWHSPNRQGLMMPANIRVYENGRAEPRVKFGVHDSEDEPGVIELDLDVSFDESIFQVPEAR